MRKLLIIIIIFSTSFIASAKFTGSFNAKYKTQNGWSKYYTVDVTFMTGYELNNATRTYDYDMYKVYGTIWWGDGQATVIKLSNYTVCGYEATWNCLKNNYWLEGDDQNRASWYICITQYCY